MNVRARVHSTMRDGSASSPRGAADDLRAVDWSGTSEAPAWASEFDAWTGEAIARKDVDALLEA